MGLKKKLGIIFLVTAPITAAANGQPVLAAFLAGFDVGGVATIIGLAIYTQRKLVQLQKGMEAIMTLGKDIPEEEQ